MQSVKFVMRQVGEPGLDRVSVQDFEEYLQYQFLSDGYEVFAQQADPIFDGADFKGYRILVTLVKNEEVKSAKK